MKTLLLILVTSIGYSQNTTVHFYYGTANNAGAEVMFALRGTESTYIGGGYSGALSPDRSVDHEKWCSIYAVGSFGYLGPIMVKYRAGLATFTNFKIVNVDYKPMAGVSAMYTITKDVGLEVGADTFNKVTLGFTILF